jgi:ribosomal protein S18 acetylase RimI-like enzyme
MTVQISKAVTADIAEVAELFIASQADAVPFLAKLHTAEETRAFIANDVFVQCEVWVARDAGRIVGMMALNGSHLDHLYLLPGHYRRGIGSDLLDKAKSLRPGKITLYAFAKNTRARAFYEHHDFRAIEFGDGSANEAGEPDILYEWQG